MYKFAGPLVYILSMFNSWGLFLHLWCGYVNNMWCSIDLTYCPKYSAGSYINYQITENWIGRLLDENV